MPKKIRILKKELWNLDSTLADIIHQYLVAFKDVERLGILYSHAYNDPEFTIDQDHEDNTDWFLDELIWTFKTISEGGTDSIPEIDALISEVFGAERAMVVSEDGEVSFNLNEEKYAKLRELTKVNQERIDRGLQLFAKYFQGLWD
jgi:hypothetical protein